MTASTKWPSGTNQPPPWLKMPHWVWWNGRSLIVHLVGNCAHQDPRQLYGLAANPRYLDWNRIHLCKQCERRAWANLK